MAALGRPLAEAPDAPPRALAQAERAILETLEHHAHLRLRPVGARHGVGSRRRGRKWVYDFAEGSKDMRELLGGKGANVAEMTRVLGADRVPAGFTITTEACVAYMKAGQEEPEGMAEQVAEALERLQEHAGKPLGDDEDPLLVSVRSGARESMPGMLDTVLNLGLNDDVGRGPGQGDRERALRVGLLPALRADVRQRRRGIDGEAFEEAIKEVKDDRGVKDDTELDVGRAEGADDRSRRLPRRLRRVPAGPAGAAAPGDPRGVRLLDRRPRGRVPPHQPHPGRLGHGGQRPADGVRQQGRHVAAPASRSAATRSPARPSRAATSWSTPRARTSSPACATRATSPRWRR